MLRNFCSSRSLGHLSLRLKKNRPQSLRTPAPCRTNNRTFTSNVTYSGGQRHEGQGGFYASGGSRSWAPERPQQHPSAVARTRDVIFVRSIMSEVSDLTSLLNDPNDPSGLRSAAVRAALNDLATDDTLDECLDRLLEFGDEPAWGLDEEERALVTEAREFSRRRERR